MHEASLAGLQQSQGLERNAAERVLLAGKQPTGRLIAPDGVAALIVSLCAPECRDITGAAIPIDGGWSAM
jgi:3-hydroxybutyrate dehydrogenase